MRFMFDVGILVFKLWFFVTMLKSFVTFVEYKTAGGKPLKIFFLLYLVDLRTIAEDLCHER